MNVSYKYFCSFKLDAGKLYLRFCLSKCISKDLQVFKLIDAARMETVFFLFVSKNTVNTLQCLYTL